jgi:hypothetical protein
LVQPSIPLAAIHSPIFSMADMGSWILEYISELSEGWGVVVAIELFMGFV